MISIVQFRCEAACSKSPTVNNFNQVGGSAKRGHLWPNEL